MLPPHCEPTAAGPGATVPQASHYGWLRDAHMLSTRGKFRVVAQLIRQPGNRKIVLSCYVALTKDSLSSSLVSGTFLWKNQEIPVGGAVGGQRARGRQGAVGGQGAGTWQGRQGQGRQGAQGRQGP